jgi:hypothetical protein
MERAEKPVSRTLSGIQRKGGLFDHPDPDFEHATIEKEDEAKK